MHSSHRQNVAHAAAWRVDAEVLEEGLHSCAEGLVAAVDGGPVCGLAADAGLRMRTRIGAIAYMESNWRQSNRGDYVHDRGECPRGYQRLPCPVTFGIVGTKSTSWPGIFPWNRDSTAAAVDVLGGWLRGCYEGWVWWLRQHGNRSRGVYRAGDLWGCVGAWYSGDWHDGPAKSLGGQNYSLRTEYWFKERPWLRLRF